MQNGAQLTDFHKRHHNYLWIHIQMFANEGTPSPSWKSWSPPVAGVLPRCTRNHRHIWDVFWVGEATCDHPKTRSAQVSVTPSQSPPPHRCHYLLYLVSVLWEHSSKRHKWLVSCSLATSSVLYIVLLSFHLVHLMKWIVIKSVLEMWTFFRVLQTFVFPDIAFCLLGDIG